MTMPTARGPFSCGEESIADALIDCGWFEKFTKSVFPGGSTAEEQAAILRSRIHFDKIPNPTEDGEVVSFPDLETQRPFVCLWPAQPAGRVAWKPGSNKVGIGMDYQLYFEAEDFDAKLDDDAIDITQEHELFRWWLNMIGVLLVGDAEISIDGLIFQPDISIRRISGVDIWHTTQAPGLGNFFSAIATVELGTQES
jgi:hypothetical protein